jgi:uncharacterized YccA/Bax inhibitor family protein
MSNNRFMSSSNPFVSDKQFSNSNIGVTKEAGLMTVQGAVNKSMILTGILFASALFVYTYFASAGTIPSMGLLYGTMFGALGIALFTYFKPTAAPISAPLYAVVEGILVGAVSVMYATFLGDGIVFNALMLTILCLASMLFAYKTGMIKATEKFRSVITTATGAIAMIYMLSIILNLFGVTVPYLHQGGMIGIGISLFIISIASLNLILDFDNIEKGAEHGAPSYMEWVSAMGLLITLVWIFFEILRLLAMLASSND